MLYIVSTPIGNLEDITLRALRILKEADYILCEDTRNSAVLLKKYAIAAKTLAFHKFNEKKLLEKIIGDLKNGKNIALVSDAGSPLINDPGQILVKECQKHCIPYTALPGPCSIINALALSGFEIDNFQFVGFLEKKESALKKHIRAMLFYDGVSVAFESPRRIIKTLKTIQELDKERELAVLREMTKFFEEAKKGPASDLIGYFEKNPVKGELVLVVNNASVKKENLSDEELIKYLRIHYNLSLKDALKEAKKHRKIRKKNLYKEQE